ASSIECRAFRRRGRVRPRFGLLGHVARRRRYRLKGSLGRLGTAETHGWIEARTRAIRSIMGRNVKLLALVLVGVLFPAILVYAALFISPLDDPIFGGD